MLRIAGFDRIDYSALLSGPASSILCLRYYVRAALLTDEWLNVPGHLMVVLYQYGHATPE